MEEIAETMITTEDDIGGSEQPNEDAGTSEEEDNQVPTDIELDEASSRRRQKGALIIYLKEEKGLEIKNTDDELNDIESSEAEVGEPAIVITNETNSELNNMNFET